MTQAYNKWQDPRWWKEVALEADDQLETIIGYFRVRLRVGQERLPVDEKFMQDRIERFERLFVDRLFAEERDASRSQR